MAGYRFTACACAALVLTAAASGTVAQQNKQTAGGDTSSATSQGEPTRLDTISVTATRNPIEAFEYPGMVTVLGREQIRARQASTPDDILKLVPNVEFTGGPRRTGEVPSIRGFSGPDVVVLIDGARQNFDSGHEGRFFIDPSLIQEVEVLRGPASSLYGSGGTGGIIAFRTALASDFLRVGETYGMSISGGYQTVNRERVETLTAFAQPAAGLDLLGSLTKRDSGSIELGNDTKLSRSDDDIIAGLAKARFDFAEHHRVEASFQRFSNETEEPNNGQGAGSGGLVDKDIRSDTVRLAYSFEAPRNDWLNLDVLAYSTASKADELRLDAGGIGPAGQLLRRDVDTLGLRLDNRSRFNPSESTAVTFTYGGEYYRDEQDGAAGAGERDGVPDATADFLGVFGQAQINIGEPFRALPGELHVIAGLRFDNFEMETRIAPGSQDSELSPRLGLSYLPADWVMLFGNYANAFRAPTFNEAFLSGTHFTIIPGFVANFFVPNPDLAPQTTRTLEFGAGLDFKDLLARGDRLQAKASHFEIEGENFIDFQVIQPPITGACFAPPFCFGTAKSINVPNAKLRGNEIEGSYENRRLRLLLGYSEIDGKDEDAGTQLGSLAPDQLTLDTAFKLPAHDAVVGWRMLAAKSFEKVNAPGDARDGYTTHDFYATWAPSSGPLKGLRVDFGVDNAFDKSYSRVFTGAVEAGRNFKAAVGYTAKW